MYKLVFMFFISLANLSFAGQPNLRKCGQLLTQAEQYEKEKNYVVAVSCINAAVDCIPGTGPLRERVLLAQHRIIAMANQTTPPPPPAPKPTTTPQQNVPPKVDPKLSQSTTSVPPKPQTTESTPVKTTPPPPAPKPTTTPPQNVPTPNTQQPQSQTIPTLDGLKVALINELGGSYVNKITEQSAAYNGMFIAAPLIHAYNTSNEHYSSGFVITKKINFDWKKLFTINQAPTSIEFFIVLQDVNSCLDWMKNTISPSLKPQHWLMLKHGDMSFKKETTYTFPCSVGLFNVSSTNTVSSQNNQISIGALTAITDGRLTAHYDQANCCSILSGDVLNFQIKDTNKPCFFFSLIQDNRSPNENKGTAITLHIILPVDEHNTAFNAISINDFSALKTQLLSIQNS